MKYSLLIFAICLLVGISLLFLCLYWTGIDLAEVCIGLLALLTIVCIYFSIQLKRLSK